MFWALFRAPFNPCQEAQAKMSLTQAQNLFMPANMNKDHRICNYSLMLFHFILSHFYSNNFLLTESDIIT